MLQNNKSLSIHNIHPYPCKFPARIAQEYLNDKGLVLDPFCGSGTTLVEAAIKGLDTIGIDCNPIAILISQCKLLNISKKEIETLNLISEEAYVLGLNCDSLTTELNEFDGRDHWFTKQIQYEIYWILERINLFDKNSPQHIILSTALSAITNKISNQDGETRYASVNKDHSKGFALLSFSEKLKQILKGIKERNPLGNKTQLVLGNLKSYDLGENIADTIITSPPYANTMDYYLYHKQRMNLLGYKFKDVMKEEIGSRHEFSSKKAPVEKWNSDYLECMASIKKALKKKGRAIIVIGDSQIAGKLISGADTTLNAAKILNLKSRIIESNSMTGMSKSFSSAFQRPNKFEHIIELIK